MSNALGWHFVGDKLRDGRPVPADGVMLTHDGPVVMCSSGLHGSRRLLDALQYAPGDVICRVRCEDIVDEDCDKFVARRRTILWRVNGPALLREFARRCALDVVGLWDAPEIVLRYLRTGDESIRDAAWAAAGDAAGDAAWAAAWAAARAAAWSAAGAAARNAAWAAAWDVARDVAWDVAREVAWDAARDVARERQNRRLTAMVVAAHRHGGDDE